MFEGEGDTEWWVGDCGWEFYGEGNFPLLRTMYANDTSTIKLKRIRNRRRWSGCRFSLFDEKVDEERFCRFSLIVMVDSQKYEKITYRILL